MRKRHLADLVAQLSRYGDRLHVREQSLLSRGDRVWMVEGGYRVVHTVRDFLADRDVEMACGAFGEIATPETRKRKHPFVTRTTLQLTCIACLAEEQP